ncbi:collagen alpha-1(XIV) chain-like [Pecten maximus]|uniref:collagen alpha-1(XIV) chain-like n=1 Tax=Pecten maximus TaxID=6579 RepID=UPI001458FB19|nr:collagen alpha-1(XIV) chain-like [Pecten maximus]
MGIWSQTKQIYKMSFLLSVLIGYALSVCNNGRLEGESFLEHHISKGVFKTVTTTGLAACQRACMERSKCKSVGYNRETLSCSLGKLNDNKLFTGDRADVYFEPDWNQTLPESLGPCRSRLCSKTETCVVLWSGNHTCITELRSVDLTVLLDFSKNTNETDFHAMISYVQHLVGQLHDVRLAAAVFGGVTSIKFRLDAFLNSSAQIEALEEISFSTITGNKIKRALNKIHGKIYNGSIGDRPEVQDVILIMFYPDDMFTSNLQETVTAVKSDGIHIVTVGKAPSDDGYAILNMTASEPLEENILTVSEYSDLLGMESQILKAINLSL